MFCIREYLLEIKVMNVNVIFKVFEINLDYLSFNVDMYIVLGDLECVKVVYNIYLKEVIKCRELV